MLLQWFWSFLMDKQQKVALGDCHSTSYSLTYGGLQGSVLSPMIFNICMKLLGEVVSSPAIGSHHYADTQFISLYYVSPRK